MIVKNNGFKKLEDDTKKTVHRAMLYHIGIIVNIILIIAVAISCIVLFKRNDGNEKNNVVPNDFVNKIEYSDYKVVSGTANKYYIIGKKLDKWHEIAKLDESLVVLGKYQNKLYLYSKTGGLYYMDFEKENPEIVKWMNYREYRLSESYETGTLSFQKAYMIEDLIYFKYNLDIAADTKASGILCIDVNADSFEDAKQVITRAKDGQWTLDVEKQIIYYLNDNNELRKYNIENEADELIIADIRNFEIDNEKVLYLRINNDYREAANSIVQAATYELKLFDMNSKEDTLIFESPLYNVTTGSLDGFAQMHNGDIYYKNGNSIIRYNNGTNEVIYTNEEGILKMFRYNDDGVITIRVDDNTPQYIYNGKVASRIPSMYNVIMKDGTMKEL